MFSYISHEEKINTRPTGPKFVFRCPPVMVDTVPGHSEDKGTSRVDKLDHNHLNEYIGNCQDKWLVFNQLLQNIILSERQKCCQHSNYSSLVTVLFPIYPYTSLKKKRGKEDSIEVPECYLLMASKTPSPFLFSKNSSSTSNSPWKKPRTLGWNREVQISNSHWPSCSNHVSQF